MKDSRKFVVIGLLLAALFFAGAILGSCKPNVMVYLIIIAVAVAAVLCIVFGYTGHAKKNDENLCAKHDFDSWDPDYTEQHQ